jgi:DNA-binding PadR family transcriptional regulator
VRRKAGVLLPIEVSILSAAVELRLRGSDAFHGFLIARAIQGREGARRLTAHGTLYKALERMERAGLLASQWEDAQIAADEGRPRRRLYQVTGVGELALRNALRDGAQLQLRPAIDGTPS